MQKKKKMYEKPRLEPVKMLEVSAASCCRLSIGTCNNAIKLQKSKTLNAS